jgi:hypothetical protein
VLSQVQLMGYAVWLAARGTGPDAIDDSLRSVGLWALGRTGTDPRLDGGGRLRKRLARVLGGIRRIHNRTGPKRAALTTDRLRMLLRILWGLEDVSFVDKLMYEAALSLGLYGLLRVSEMVQDTTTRRRAKGATRGDVMFSRDEAGRVTHNEFIIQRSKCDPLSREQASAKVFAPNAVSAMVRYLSARRGRHADVLFTHDDGSFLNRNRLDRLLKRLCGLAGLDASRFSTHSMRAGGATTLSLLGIKPYLIKRLGRWASDAYQIYIRTPDAQLRAIQERMACMPALASNPRDQAALAGAAWQALQGQLEEAE